ncbi:MAG: flagellar hook-basal body complex protein FliE [Nitrospirae bacterium]|nr:flagellar hook-basal body complex protein FliE [Nitrospirota bacterium]
MSDFKITSTTLQDIQPQSKAADAGAAPAGGFDDTLKDALSRVNAIQKEADKAIEALSSGGDVTNAVLAMQKADMSFQLMQEVRSKLLNAYDEVMKMQV